MKPSFSKSESGISSIGTSYDVNKKAEITLSYDRKKYFLSKFGTIKINCSSVVSSTTLNIKITDDENGNVGFLPDTSASLDFGLTDTSKAFCVIDISSMLYSDVETFYCFVKVDTGSLNVDSIVITFEN